MKLNESLRRWIWITFPPAAPDKKQARQTAVLWKGLLQDRPLWYNPVTDQLTRDFALALLRVKAAADALGPALGVQGPGPVAPSLVPSLVGRLADRFLEKAQLTRDQLSFERIYSEVSAQKGADYRGMQHLLQSRMQALPKGEGALWEASLPTIEGLVHLASFDWGPLGAVLAVAGGRKSKLLGVDFVDALEDLAFVLEPLTFNPTLELLVGLLDPGPASQAVAPLALARAPLLADGQLLNVIRAIRGVPEHPFRRMVYEPPNLSSVYREWIADFDAQLRNHQNETERLRLAARMKEVFGNRELVPFPSYNAEVSGRLVERKLPELTQVGAIHVLHNFRELFHPTLFRPLFAAMPLQFDFLTLDAKAEFQAGLDTYDGVEARIAKFLEDFLSPTYSPLAPVVAALGAPFLDQRAKQALKKPIDETNRRAYDLCRQSYRQIKALALLLEKYQMDLTDPKPRLISGGAVLVDKHPELVANLRAGTATLKGLSGLLRHLVADLEEPRES